MKTLSANNIQLRVIPRILIAGILLFTFIIFFKNNIQWLLIGIFAIIGLIVWHVVKIYRTVYNVFYDAEFLHLQNSQQDRKINLKNVHYIKRTTSTMKVLGMQYSEYRIAFASTFGMIEHVTIWVYRGNDAVTDFQNCLDSDIQNRSV